MGLVGVVKSWHMDFLQALSVESEVAGSRFCSCCAGPSPTRALLPSPEAQHGCDYLTHPIMCRLLWTHTQ
jgi:hypothetical protein